MTAETRVTPEELAAYLRTDRAGILAMVREGLPWCSGGKRKRFAWERCWFDEDAAAEWLVEAGYLKRPRVATSIGEVAAHYGVSKRAIWQWREQGAPIGDDGLFDLDALDAWREARRGKDGGANDETRSVYETDRARIRAQREQLELDQARGLLVEAKLVAHVLERHIAEATTHLESLPEFALTLLPADAKKALIVRFRTELQRRCDQIREALAGSLESLAAEVEKTKPKRPGLVIEIGSGA